MQRSGLVLACPVQEHVILGSRLKAFRAHTRRCAGMQSTPQSTTAVHHGPVAQQRTEEVVAGDVCASKIFDKTFVHIFARPLK